MLTEKDIKYILEELENILNDSQAVSSDDMIEDILYQMSKYLNRKENILYQMSKYLNRKENEKVNDEIKGGD
jgi:ElaB/YqjD/DUF883 family membrane-anchored ribosome-binding protein